MVFEKTCIEALRDLTGPFSQAFSHLLGPCGFAEDSFFGGGETLDSVVVDFFEDSVDFELKLALVGDFALAHVRTDLEFYTFPPAFREDVSGAGGHSGKVGGVTSGICRS